MDDDCKHQPGGSCQHWDESAGRCRLAARDRTCGAFPETTQPLSSDFELFDPVIVTPPFGAPFLPGGLL